MCFGETEEQSNREERALATPFLGQPPEATVIPVLGLSVCLALSLRPLCT